MTVVILVDRSDTDACTCIDDRLADLRTILADTTGEDKAGDGCGPPELEDV
jgi:hypothetical protein